MGRFFSGDLAALEGALADEVAAIKRSDRLAPVTIIVGSAALTSHLSRVLAERLGGHANVRLVTLFGLASSLARRAGLCEDRVLTEEARLRLVERIVAQVTARPRGYFSRLAGARGLAPAMARTIDDLRQAGVPAAADWGLSDAAAVELRDALIAFEAALESAGAVDRAGVYGLACRALESHSGTEERAPGSPEGGLGDGWPPGPVMVYGLYDLPQCQRDLLLALGRRFDLSVFLPSGRRGGEYAQPGRRFFSALGLTEGELPASGCAGLELLSVGDDQDEVDEVARLLRVAAAAGGRYHEVAAVAPSVQRADELARGLRQLGFPVARSLPATEGGPARLTSLLEMALPAAGEAWARAAVIAHATGLAAAGALPEADVARWAEESRQAGVLDGDDWGRLTRQQRWLAGMLGDLRAGREDDEASSSAGRAASLQRRLDAVAGLAAFVRRLRSALADLPAVAGWPELVAKLQSLAADLGAVSADDPALGALGELVRCGLVEDEVNAKDAAGVIRARLARLREPHGSIGRRGVAVLTPHELRGLRFPTVVFTGLCSGGFPAATGGDPLLSDLHRRHLARRFGVYLEEAEARDREADLLLDLARQGAGESFVGTVPRRDASGAARQPSRAAVELAEEIVGRTVVAEDFSRAPLTGAALRRTAGGPQPAVVSAAGEVTLPGGRPAADGRERDVSLLLALAQGSPLGRAAGEARRYLEAFCGRATARRLLGRRASGVAAGVLAWDGVFFGRRARRALGRAGLFAAPVAPTTLQEYQRCPFAFYVSSVLGLDPVEDPEVLDADGRVVGTIVHRVLQEVFARVRDEGLTGQQAGAATRDVVQRACRVAEERGPVGAPLLWRLRQDQLAEDLTRAVADDPLWTAPDDRRPWELERAFGGDGEQVTLTIPGGRRLQFRGRIDRVDRSAEGRRLDVIDYKSGRGGSERTQVEAGRDIQLPVYALAARSLPGAQGAEEVRCVFRMVTRRRDHAEVALPPDPGLVTAQLADTVSLIVELVEDGVFPRLGAAARSCDWCRFGYACDELAWTRERKAVHPRLARLAALRGPWQAGGAAASRHEEIAGEAATDA